MNTKRSFKRSPNIMPQMLSRQWPSTFYRVAWTLKPNRNASLNSQPSPVSHEYPRSGVYPLKHTARLIVSCPDHRGLVARVSDFIFRNGGNIVHFDQHTDLQVGVFLARMEWELDGFQIPRDKIA